MSSPPQPPAEGARIGLMDVWRGLRPSYDGPNSWLWFVGVGRLALLLLMAVGAQTVMGPMGVSYFLIVLYLGAAASGLWYLVVLRGQGSVSALLTWTQMVVDFGMVAATISYTGGHASFFTFLLVPVILEAGVLMGLVQGFVFATLSSAFMLFLFAFGLGQADDPLAHWYNYLIQGIAFFFTAFISGYWNQRVSRMKQFQREILDNMNSGFLITDRKGIVLAVNKSGCDILNLREGDVAGRHVDGVMRPESGTECPVTTALRLEKDFASYEFHADVGDEDPKLIGLTTSRIRDFRGVSTGLIASFTDLTEMARMRRELQQQDRMAVIGELAASLAHEIRNPVASIRSAAAELQRSLDDPRILERLANIAVRESDHLNEIVTGFLDFARNPVRQRARVDMGDVLRDARERLLRKFDRAEGLRIDLELPAFHCQVRGNKTQLMQVLVNMGQNAVEAMNTQGRLVMGIRLSGGLEQEGAAHGPLEIYVDDEGPGIPPDQVARIFEPFYTDKARGVGMGLAICMRIITAHDGTVQVASRAGGGTSMRIRLPAAIPPNRDTAAPGEEAPGAEEEKSP